ncbi:MAG: MBL fold metallo-hydrolase [bacterium]
MILHLLGLGTPDPSSERFGSAFLLEVGDELIMIDCGPAAVYKMARLGKYPMQVNRLLFTHHHSDHNMDYPCFLLTRWDQDHGDRTKIPPLRVCGPPPTVALTERLIGKEGAFREDLVARIEAPVSQLMHTNRGGSLPRWWPEYDVRDIEPGVVEENDRWKITAVEVTHLEPWLIEYGYRVETPEGVVAFTGDAGPCDGLDELAAGADVLVMCCAHTGNLNPLTMAAVTGAPDVARVASNAGVKTVVLTHSPVGRGRPGNREHVVATVAKGFDGQIIFADELTTLNVP